MILLGFRGSSGGRGTTWSFGLPTAFRNVSILSSDRLKSKVKKAGFGYFVPKPAEPGACEVIVAAMRNN